MKKQTQNSPVPGRAIITFSRGWQTLVATRSLGRRGVAVKQRGPQVAVVIAALRRCGHGCVVLPIPVRAQSSRAPALFTCGHSGEVGRVTPVQC